VLAARDLHLRAHGLGARAARGGVQEDEPSVAQELVQPPADAREIGHAAAGPRVRVGPRGGIGDAYAGQAAGNGPSARAERHDQPEDPRLNCPADRGAAEDQPRTGVLIEELTDREQAVLRALTSDATQREIGAALYLSINTVKGYTKVLYRKLGVVTRQDAVRQARALGLL
jgi:DNA-binding CsgD family transcriptional regulator